MTESLHELLKDAAPTPSRPVDVDALIGKARRRRRWFTGGTVVVVVGALFAIGLLAASGGSDHSTSVAIRSSGDAVTPSGWTTVSLGNGTSIALPAGWRQIQFSTTFPGSLGAVGRTDPGVSGVLTACGVPASDSTVTGTWVTLYELPAVADPIEVTLPDGGQTNGGAFVDRPATFQGRSGMGGECATSTLTPGGTEPPTAAPSVQEASFATYLFRDHGRFFAARVFTDAVPNQDHIDQALEVLDTFAVAHATQPSGTTVVPFTTVPPVDVPATTAPPPDFQGEEAAIAQMMTTWASGPGVDATVKLIEDGEALRGTITAVDASPQVQAARDPGIRIHSIELVGEDHAILTFDLLLGTDVSVGGLTGATVKIDGSWRLSRDTYCRIAQYVQVTCPAP